MTDEQEFQMHRQPWVLFQSQGNLLALPIATVEQMVPKGLLYSLPGAGGGHRSLMKLRDSSLPVMDLAGVMEENQGWDRGAAKQSAPLTNGAEGVPQTVIVLGWNQRRLGLVVDRLVGVEPLPKRSHGIMQVAPGLKGSDTPVNGFAIRGSSGDLVLLLDVEWLLGMGGTAKQAGAA